MLITIQALGGLGLFLLGMIVMTEGLRALAGDTMRGLLLRFTQSPLSGATTGALTTAILQSSSATTVAAVGFVGAGLLTFPQALGIIFGANIGTTITGWLVVLVGFKLKLGTLLLPLIFLGTILRLFTAGRWSHSGYTLAGFGLIFVGIATMQEAMAGLQGTISFASLAGDSIIGRLQLVALGIVFTLITQSSSAGVATTLTALFTGMIQFEQAAALVIGMDIGTTATAAFATIGATVGARRTGYSHVIYNLITGLTAFILITPYISLWQSLAPGALSTNSGIALVAFHSSFNALGIIVVLPFSRQFASFMEGLVPEKASVYTRSLDRSLLKEPAVGLQAIKASLQTELQALLHHVSALLGDANKGGRVDLQELQTALDTSQSFIDQIHLPTSQGKEWEQLMALIHTLDHMQRLHERCAEEEVRAMTAGESEELIEQRNALKLAVADIIDAFEQGSLQKAAELANQISQSIERQRKDLRQTIMEHVASGKLNVPMANYRLEAVRWLNRVSTHLERIMYHLSLTNGEHGSSQPRNQTDREAR